MWLEHDRGSGDQHQSHQAHAAETVIDPILLSRPNRT